MAEERTDRHALPLLQAGQAQKEMTHNEALVLLDLIAGAAAEAVAEVPPAEPEPGQCWIVGAAPVGAWTGQADALAGWTESGWRFVVPREGLVVWLAAAGCPAAWQSGAWRIGAAHARSLSVDGVQVVGAQQPAIADPAGGGTVDAEARGALAAILAALRTHGLVAPA
jgi:hypothetical protein